ncbi:aspartate/glutamate racemase family protein [Nonomuraea angiospora]|uniref:Maleate isomerase n=1 Tax=Nonomuraea angiospora TaxID=46172 RepID=A0ABR9LV92_9ACTN|nr:aspartate/glutamate racemase family protein [Nonomuraea angiospora]MBE1584571.1 maleate isomerase [Nonomuraea angiospora]
MPWANTVVEAELPQWGRGRTVWHYARLVPAHGGTALDEDFLSGLIEAVPGALHQLSRLSLELSYLACTSAAFTQLGRLADVTAGSQVRVVSAFEAILAQLQKHGARKIALITPYPREITEVEVTQFAERGVLVTGSASLGLADGYAEVTLNQQAALVDQLGKEALRQADAIVLSCTGWPTQAAIRMLRRRLGRLVTSSNAAIAQHALGSTREHHR